MTQPKHTQDNAFGFLQQETRGGRLRLQTFTLIRWIAIAGQIAAILFAQHYFALRLEMGLLYLVIGAAIVANLVFYFTFPENRRLTEAETLMMLLFDLAQLLLMLFLTGGLHNPFAMLVLAPVTVSATALRLRSTLIIGFIAIIGVTLLAFFRFPLMTASGFEMHLPLVFLYGIWVAIVTATAFLAIYTHWVASEISSMSTALLAAQMALSREQKLTDLGGVIAAAAHELGTPLATIKLASSELIDDLDKDSPLREDAELIRDQADRCREIMRGMGRAGKDDTHLRTAPLPALIEEAAEPHADRGKALLMDFHAVDGGGPVPVLFRQPEIIHGLRNFIQNAVDFASESVKIDARWSEHSIWIRISDDGPGFPSGSLGLLGEPFQRRRKASASPGRKEYEGMGLGMFIAKTLLSRSGATVSFANKSSRTAEHNPLASRKGAVVEVRWNRGEAGPEDLGKRSKLADNPNFEA